jgi:uncharacterized protein
MSFISRLLGRRWRLSAPLTQELATEPLRIPVRDGLELLADRYYSRHDMAQPTVLIRTCYGRRNFFKFLAVLFAERGVQVVVQSCRGTNGSQGTFRPFLDEQNDGEDTVKWIERQPWFTGDLALWGISYLGYTAWAVANSSVKDKVKAISLHVTLTNFRDRTYAFGGFTLLGSMDFTATMLGVLRTSGLSLLSNPRKTERGAKQFLAGLVVRAAPFALLRARIRARRTTALMPQAMKSVPLRKADQILAPEGISWWQDWMDHAEPDDPWWDAADFGQAAKTIPPTVMVGGWYDLFLPWQLKDFMAAQLAGRDVRIIIGPWMHASPLGIAESLRQSIALFQERFAIGPNKTGDGASKPRVRLFLMGADEWREYPSWPIPNITDRTYFLHTGGTLASAPPASENTSTYDYDPSRPTPSFYGPTTEGRSGSGDMAELERRSDVLIFSSEPLRADLDVIGTIAGEIFLRSSTEYTDVYLCLCDVAPGSRSTNVCDGYTRLRPDLPATRQAS